MIFLQAPFSSERSAVVNDTGETVSHSGVHLVTTFYFYRNTCNVMSWITLLSLKPKRPFFDETEEESLDASQQVLNKSVVCKPIFIFFN